MERSGQGFRAVMDDMTQIFIEQGILGAILIVAFWWIRSQNAQAKLEREALQEKLFDLFKQTNEFDQTTGHQLKEMRTELQRLADRIEGRRP